MCSKKDGQLLYLVAGKWIDSFVIVVVAPAELRIRSEVWVALGKSLLACSWPSVVGGLARRGRSGDQFGVLGIVFHNKSKEFRAKENKEQQNRQMDNWQVVRCGHHGWRRREAYTLIAHHSGGSGRYCKIENESDRWEESGFGCSACKQVKSRGRGSVRQPKILRS